jgi:tetratricopeptide (TPR) repeat protein
MKERYEGDLLPPHGLAKWFGMCYLGMEKYDEAIRYLSQARRRLSAAPVDLSYVRVLFDLGCSYYYSQDTKRALEVFREAEKHLHFFDNAEYQWGYVDCLLLLAHSMVVEGHEQSAAETIDRARKYFADKDPSPELQTRFSVDFAHAYWDVHDYRMSYDFLQRVVLDYLNPEHRLSYHVFMFRVCEKLRKWEEILSTFKSFLAMGGPDDYLAEAYHYAGRAHYSLGHGREAVEHFKKSLTYPTKYSKLTEYNNWFLTELKKAGYT